MWHFLHFSDHQCDILLPELTVFCNKIRKKCVIKRYHALNHKFYFQNHIKNLSWNSTKISRKSTPLSLSFTYLFEWPVTLFQEICLLIKILQTLDCTYQSFWSELEFYAILILLESPPMIFAQILTLLIWQIFSPNDGVWFQTKQKHSFCLLHSTNLKLEVRSKPSAV